MTKPALNISCLAADDPSACSRFVLRSESPLRGVVRSRNCRRLKKAGKRTSCTNRSPLQKPNDPISQFIKLGGFRLTLPDDHNPPPKPPKLFAGSGISGLVALQLGLPELLLLFRGVLRLHRHGDNRLYRSVSSDHVSDRMGHLPVPRSPFPRVLASGERGTCLGDRLGFLPC